MPQLFAQPYNLNAQGFYFENKEEYEEKAAQCFDAYGAFIEEYEIEDVDEVDRDE